MLKRIFVIVSILFLSFMIIFYGCRLFYYYSAEHKKKIVITLSNQIITASEKLVQIDDSFYFNGDVQNNYLYYSGIVYRIISLNDNYLTLISNEDLTKLRYGASEDYSSSDVKLWLENEYIKNLNTELLYENKVQLLNLETYMNVGESNSFIKSDGMWIENEGKGLMLDENGDVNTPSSYNYFLSVRPIIKIKNINYIKGTGTIDNPYLVENKIVNTLEDTYVGQYIKYKDNIYRIISKNNGIKVVSTSSIGKHKFSDSTVSYESGSNEDLYNYLNTEFLSTLNSEELILTEWNIGTYNTSYKDTISNTISSYIGLLTVGDYFINDISGYILAPMEDTIFTINEDKNLYLVNPSSEKDIYPSFNLKIELRINGGLGTKTSPYEVGEE